MRPVSRRHVGGEPEGRRRRGGRRASCVAPCGECLPVAPFGGGAAAPRRRGCMGSESGRAGGTGKRLLWAECIHGLRLLGSEFGRAGGTEKDSRVPGADRGEGFAAFARCGSDLDRSKGKALELDRVLCIRILPGVRFSMRGKGKPRQPRKAGGAGGFPLRVRVALESLLSVALSSARRGEFA